MTKLLLTTMLLISCFHLEAFKQSGNNIIFVHEITQYTKKWKLRAALLLNDGVNDLAMVNNTSTFVVSWLVVANEENNVRLYAIPIV